MESNAPILVVTFPDSLDSPAISKQLFNPLTKSSQFSTTSTMGKCELDVLTVSPPADPTAASTVDGQSDGSRTQYGLRTPTNNVTEVTLEELLKTPTKKPESNPDILPTSHVARIIGRVPFQQKMDNLNAEEFQVMLFHECKGSLVGFMKVETFLDTFLPWQREPLDIPQDAPHFPVYTKGLEKLMYAPFLGVTRQIGLENTYFVDTHKSRDPNSLIRDIMPDMTVYTKGPKDAIEGQDFAKMALWLEFKPEQTDFFEDVVGSSLDGKLSKEAAFQVGQLITYAVSHLSSGFYTHTFSVFVYGNKARLFRWDRAGGIISEAFDYVTTRTLEEFFLRFDQSTPEQRGRDPTVTHPSHADRQLAARALLPEKAEDESEIDFKKRKEYFNPDTFLEYLVNDSKTGQTRRFVGPPPQRQLLCLQGRASRGAPVYDVETREVCYLKDTWRINSSMRPTEGETYDRLHAAKVEHIAGVVVHCDVAAPNITKGSSGDGSHSIETNDHVTKTDIFGQSDESWCTLKPRLQSYRHYRIVLDMVGRDLSLFESSRELLIVVLDAMIAHYEAYFHAEILHRDISPGNIMITSDGRGFLIDWDLAKDINSEGARSLGRTGTRQFISGKLLAKPDSKIHEFSDDLESFLHLLLYMFIRFTESNFTPQEILRCMESIFDNPSDEVKRDKLGSGFYVPDELVFSGRNNITLGLDTISLLFQDLYRPLRRGAEIMRAAQIRLNAKDGSGLAFQSTLLELIQTSDYQWTSKGPSILIPLPLSKAREMLGRYIAMLQFPTSFQSSASLKYCSENPYTPPDGPQEPLTKLRRTIQNLEK